ncbi:SHOCT domain-containing protein [Velocimicrobium porci]|uniref:Conjugal transfer protein n=1 Tax=Velocimicrobium porci TaxID=2606634 RepID=A0A6L5XZF7_9FIRM|nr:conjugal transfer protein [Velocimicrobium porci]
MNAEKLLQYSMELSLLAQLLQSKQITETEYQRIKIKLMKEYHVLSDITAMTA